MIKDLSFNQVRRFLSYKVRSEDEYWQIHVYEDDGTEMPISIQEKEFIIAPCPEVRLSDAIRFIASCSKGYLFQIRFLDFDLKAKAEDLEFRIVSEIANS